MFFQHTQTNKFDDHIQKLEENIVYLREHKSKLETQLTALKYKATRGVTMDEFSAPEKRFMWELSIHETQSKIENSLVAIAAQQDRIKTLKQMSQGNPISQAQYEQLMLMKVLARDENILNYPNVLVSNSIQTITQ